MKKYTAILKCQHQQTNEMKFFKFRNVTRIEVLVVHLDKVKNYRALYANLYDPETRQQVKSWTNKAG